MTGPAPEVRVGQVWADNDKRSVGRRVRILELPPPEPCKSARALVVQCDCAGRAIRTNGRERRTRIAINRFRPTSTGYRLEVDAP